MRIKKPDWITYTERAKRAKEKVLNRICKRCGRPLSVGGVSAYEDICKECADEMNLN